MKQQYHTSANVIIQHEMMISRRALNLQALLPYQIHRPYVLVEGHAHAQKLHNTTYTSLKPSKERSIPTESGYHKLSCLFLVKSMRHTDLTKSLFRGI
jgi:hypothetical protein